MNQYLIGEKIIFQKDYEKFNKLFLNKLKSENIDILDVFYRPHARIENCDCCKPQPGLIKQALEKYPNIELEKSFFVGDSICDMNLAEHFGLKFYGIGLKCKHKMT